MPRAKGAMASSFDILDPETLAAEAATWDALATATPGIDGFCSSTPWMLAAHRGLMPGRPLFFARGESGAMTLAEHRLPDRRAYWEPLEAMWGFGCPAVGADLDGATAAGLTALAEASAWRAVVLSGIPLVPEPAARVGGLAPPRSTVRLVSQSRRRVASLAGGFDGYLRRRSSGFRGNLAKARRRAQETGIVIESVAGTTDPSASLAALDRALAIEAQSWKGMRRVGIDAGGMREFYRHMLPLLAERSALRFVWVTLDGRDVAYHFGAVLGDGYRGLQHSYVNDLRHLSLGALAHAAAIEAACGEGMQSYDLGQETAYKQRWAESTFATATLLVLR